MKAKTAGQIFIFVSAFLAYLGPDVMGIYLHAAFEGVVIGFAFLTIIDSWCSAGFNKS